MYGAEMIVDDCTRCSLDSVYADTDNDLESVLIMCGPRKDGDEDYIGK